MTRSIIYYFLLLSMLSMNVEGAKDIASDVHSSSGDKTLIIDSSDDVGSDSERETNHCEHCCHAHVVSFASQIPVSLEYSGVVGYQLGTTPHVLNPAQAPPTPPPNA